MTGTAAPVRVNARGWTYAGFARAGTRGFEHRDDLHCWIEPSSEGNLLLLWLSGPLDSSNGRPVSRRLARRLGDLLVDAGCLALFTGGKAATDEIRTRLTDQDLVWWVRFSACCPAQRVELYADGPAGHTHLRLWPVEAIGLGARLIRAGDEWAARQSQAEAA